jgi:hypothetical protein
MKRLSSKPNHLVLLLFNYESNNIECCSNAAGPRKLSEEGPEPMIIE